MVAVVVVDHKVVADKVLKDMLKYQSIQLLA